VAYFLDHPVDDANKLTMIYVNVFIVFFRTQMRALAVITLLLTVEGDVERTGANNAAAGATGRYMASAVSQRSPVMSSAIMLFVSLFRLQHL